jgi:hypothetical protein
MAISVDATSNTTNEFSSQSSQTWSHTIGSGAGRLLIVGSMTRDGASDVSSITYGGTALTKGIDAKYSGENSELWYMYNPPVGVANIVVTFTGSTNYGSVAAVSFFGCGKTPVDTDSNAAGGGMATINLTTTKDDAVGIHCFYKQGGTVSAPTGTETIVLSKDPNSDNDRTGMSYKIFTSAGANTMSNWGGSGDHSQSALAFDSATPEGGSFIFNLL